MGRFTGLGETREEFSKRKKENAALAYERKIVTKLCKVFGYTKLTKALKRMPHREDESGWFMTYDWLNDEHPTLPFRLVNTARTPKRVAEFFWPRKRSNLWLGWTTILREFGETTRSGIPVAWPIRFLEDPEPGDMVMYSTAFPDDNNADRPIMTLPLNDGRVVTLEPFNNFLNRFDITLL